MKKLVSVLIIAGALTTFNMQVFAQDLLPVVTVTAANYKYLKSVTDTAGAEQVKLLQRRAASFDVKNSEYYEDEYENYFISFYIPKGEILAVYDQSGKLIRTAERFQNVGLPAAVRNAVTSRYPNWAITKDVYLVKYAADQGGQKIYKLLLENGSKRLRIKTDDKGTIL